MRRHTKRKLTLDRETIRRLNAVQLEAARGGASIAPDLTCSQCYGFTGCHTGDACP